MNLRATLAGMETMLEYGMMREWDEKTRAWVRQSVARNFPVREGEEIVAKMAGGHYQEGFAKVWRPGSLFVTTQRLVAFRRDPKEVLWESDFENITALVLHDERTIGGEHRTRLRVHTADGETTSLSAAAPERIKNLVAQQTPLVKSAELPAKSEPDGPVMEGHMWYLEQRANGSTWRGGTAWLDRHKGLSWQAPTDSRPAVQIRLADVVDIWISSGQTPARDSQVLLIETNSGSVQLSTADVAAWQRKLVELTHSTGAETRSIEEPYGT